MGSGEAFSNSPKPTIQYDGDVIDALSPEEYKSDHGVTAGLALGALANVYNSRFNPLGTTLGNGAEKYRLNSWVVREDSRFGNALALPSVEDVHSKDQIMPVYFTVDLLNKDVLSADKLVMPTESNLLNNLKVDKEMVEFYSDELQDLFDIDDLRTIICLINKAKDSIRGHHIAIDPNIHMALSCNYLDDLVRLQSAKPKSVSEQEVVSELRSNWDKFEDLATERFLSHRDCSEVIVEHEYEKGKFCVVKLRGPKNKPNDAEIFVLDGNMSERKVYFFKQEEYLGEQEEDDSKDVPDWDFKAVFATLKKGRKITNQEFVYFCNDAYNRSYEDSEVAGKIYHLDEYDVA